MPTVARRTGDNQLVQSTGVAQGVMIAPAGQGAAAEIFRGGKKGIGSQEKWRWSSGERRWIRQRSPATQFPRGRLGGAFGGEAAVEFSTCHGAF
jgi:hypothetical protein